MQIVFQLGVHCTDDGRLVRSLLRSRAALDDKGIYVPGPRRYRSLLRETLTILGGTPASDDVEQLLLDSLIDTDGVQRMLLFHENLITLPQRAISEEGLYAALPTRLGWLRDLFPSHSVEFHLALCNPATLIPTIALRHGAQDYETITAGADPASLSWLSTIRKTLQANPGTTLTLWCNEDTPLIWPELLRSLAALPPKVALEGDLDMVEALLSEEGSVVLRDSLRDVPSLDVTTRRDKISAALESYGKPEEMAVDVSLPGWSGELISRMTARYVADCAEIAKLPGVKFIAP